MMSPAIAQMLGVGSMVVAASVDYPPHLFEHSPLMPETVIIHDCPKGQQIVQLMPVARPKIRHHRVDANGCHHYSYWGYPYPQPC